MNRVPRVGGRDLLAALQRGGFEVTHVRGSHHYLSKAGHAGIVVVPVHANRTIPAGTLRSIIRQTGLTDAEFINLL